MKTAEEFGRAIDDMVWADELAAITARDAEHRTELDALRKSYEEANARGGEANERLQRQLREAEDANVMSAALIERLRGELGRAVELLTRVPKYVREDRAVTPGSTRLSRLCLSIDAFLAPPPAESTPEPATPDCRQPLCCDTACRWYDTRHRGDHAAPPDDIWARLEQEGRCQGMVADRQCTQRNGHGGGCHHMYTEAVMWIAPTKEHRFVPQRRHRGIPIDLCDECAHAESHPCHPVGAKP